MNTRFRIALTGQRVAALFSLFLCAAGVAVAPQPAAAQTRFATAEEAAAALAKAAGGNDTAALRALMGPQGDRLVGSGDPVADKAARERFATAYAARHLLAAGAPGRMILSVGDNDWPLPIPIVQGPGGWQFDAAAGAEELIDRRIGGNELSTIRTLLAVVLAEKDYFDRTRRGSGVGFYAQRVLSTPGKMDGLYWETQPGEAPSPLTPLVQHAVDEGYPGATSRSGQPVPYHGYYYRLLKEQGPNAPGGAKSFVRNGQMTEGFAFIAWPSRYESSGIMSFMVGPDGTMYQRNLGPNTAQMAAGLARFDPDINWVPVKLTD